MEPSGYRQNVAPDTHPGDEFSRRLRRDSTREVRRAPTFHFVADGTLVRTRNRLRQVGLRCNRTGRRDVRRAGDSRFQARPERFDFSKAVELRTKHLPVYRHNDAVLHG
jgi:hypothetical protein